jgi:protein involved in polysaccharide export with SLBB domain
MIPFSKTAAVLSVALCGALTIGARAQDPDEPRPRRAPATRQERPDRGQSNPFADEEEAPAPAAAPPRRPGSPEQPPPGYAASSRLSEEAQRSFREIPPGSDRETETLPPAQAPADRAAGAQPRPAAAKAPLRPEYIVDPPDLVLVEVLEALPGRPISGERLVRPDGRISLGFYGELPVAGLTLPQIKERIVLHLRKFINDDVLGLVEFGEDGELKRDAYGRIILKDPRDTDRVFVDVTLYNSKNYYVLGDVLLPGKLPCTGGETVLDAIQYAGGLIPTAEKAHIQLIRSFPKGSPAQVLPINYEEIAMGTDSSTNYMILPGDRLVIPGVSLNRSGGGVPGRGASSGPVPAQDARVANAKSSRSGPSLYFNRGAYDASRRATADLEKRIDELEKKLDQLITIVQNHAPKPDAGPDEEPAAKLGQRPPRLGELNRVQAEEPSPMPGTAVPSLEPFPQAPAPRRPAPMQPRPSGGVRPQSDRSADSHAEHRLDIPDLPEDRPPSEVLPPDLVPER